mgnify:CR=1 FL=1
MQVDVALDRVELLVGRARAGEADRHADDLGARLHHVLQRRLRERHHVLHRLRKTAAAAIPDEEAALDALARFHHARDLQAAQCVACCRASDAEALGQFALAGELVARLQLAAHQLFANAVAHGLEATPGAHRLEERFVGHERSF